MSVMAPLWPDDPVVCDGECEWCETGDARPTSLRRYCDCPCHDLDEYYSAADRWDDE
jgi:hypothetical protein